MFATGLDTLIAPWHFYHVGSCSETRAWRKAMSFALEICTWCGLAAYRLDPRTDRLLRFYLLKVRTPPARKRKGPPLTILLDCPFRDDWPKREKRVHNGWITPVFGKHTRQDG